ncbi:uncharacterized protein I303_107504 [Kwoniella dejecticola CBS 10117]|uniref:BRCT domain-containing protein n=1 Tax=Kwoniella dejecticola CBS 10117 TaxID=1296121 RepID=A0A1A5ZZV8_9TREE|nr:uncharacterized protein I303_06909 [Kwoniella dejecticola CBS 10117]OBR83344.1 hypothetical protein I303_06909 [Kwoniella dejecticola CBS 10117]
MNFRLHNTDEPHEDGDGFQHQRKSLSKPTRIYPGPLFSGVGFHVLPTSLDWTPLAIQIKGLISDNGGWLFDEPNRKQVKYIIVPIPSSSSSSSSPSSTSGCFAETDPPTSTSSSSSSGFWNRASAKTQDIENQSRRQNPQMIRRKAETRSTISTPALAPLLPINEAEPEYHKLRGDQAILKSEWVLECLQKDVILDEKYEWGGHRIDITSNKKRSRETPLPQPVVFTNPTTSPREFVRFHDIDRDSRKRARLNRQRIQVASTLPEPPLRTAKAKAKAKALGAAPAPETFPDPVPTPDLVEAHQMNSDQAASPQPKHAGHDDQYRHSTEPRFQTGPTETGFVRTHSRVQSYQLETPSIVDIPSCPSVPAPALAPAAAVPALAHEPDLDCAISRQLYYPEDDTLPLLPTTSDKAEYIRTLEQVKQLLEAWNESLHLHEAQANEKDTQFSMIPNMSDLKRVEQLLDELSSIPRLHEIKEKHEALSSTNDTEYKYSSEDTIKRLPNDRGNDVICQNDASCISPIEISLLSPVVKTYAESSPVKVKEHTNDNDVQVTHAHGLFSDATISRPIRIYAEGCDFDLLSAITTNGGQSIKDAAKADVILFHRPEGRHDLTPQNTHETVILREAFMRDQKVLSSRWVDDCVRHGRLLTDESYAIWLSEAAIHTRREAAVRADRKRQSETSIIASQMNTHDGHIQGGGHISVSKRRRTKRSGTPKVNVQGYGEEDGEGHDEPLPWVLGLGSELGDDEEFDGDGGIRKIVIDPT